MSDDACDLSEVRALTRFADDQLSSVPTVMLEVLKNRAELERRTHVFNNITGLLEANTRAQMVSRDEDPATAELIMDRPYASHVQGRGRTDIEKRAAEAERIIQSKFERMAERIAQK